MSNDHEEIDLYWADFLCSNFKSFYVGEWMCPVSESSKLGDRKQQEHDFDSEPKGDPEMAPLYLQQLLPVFCQLYQRSMVRSVR